LAASVDVCTSIFVIKERNGILLQSKMGNAYFLLLQCWKERKTAAESKHGAADAKPKA